MSTKKLVFDIETVGADFDSFDRITQESLTRWVEKESSSETEYEEALNELKNGLGFSPLTGEIVVIGVLDCGKNQGVIYFQAPGNDIKEFSENEIIFKQATEKEMLEKFWQGAKEYDEFIGFNSRGIRRAVFNGEIRDSWNKTDKRFNGRQVFISAARRQTHRSSRSAYFLRSGKKKGESASMEPRFRHQKPQRRGNYWR